MLDIQIAASLHDFKGLRLIQRSPKPKKPRFSDDIGDAADKDFAVILRTFDFWTPRGFGWTFGDDVLVLWLDIAWYRPMKGGSFLAGVILIGLRNTRSMMDLMSQIERVEK